MNLENVNYNLDELKTKIEQNDQTGTIFINGRDKLKRQAMISFKCNVISEGIFETDYGCQLYCELEDYQLFEEAFIPQVNKIVDVINNDEYEFKELYTSNGKLYLKLKQNETGQFKSKFSPNFTTLDKSPIKLGSKIEVKASLGFYVDFEKKIFGAFIQPKMINLINSTNRKLKK